MREREGIARIIDNNENKQKEERHYWRTRHGIWLNKKGSERKTNTTDCQGRRKSYMDAYNNKHSIAEEIIIVVVTSKKGGRQGMNIREERRRLHVRFEWRTLWATAEEKVLVGWGEIAGGEGVPWFLRYHQRVEIGLEQLLRPRLIRWWPACTISCNKFRNKIG